MPTCTIVKKTSDHNKPLKAKALIMLSGNGVLYYVSDVGEASDANNLNMIVRAENHEHGKCTDLLVVFASDANDHYIGEVIPVDDLKGRGWRFLPCTVKAIIKQRI